MEPNSNVHTVKRDFSLKIKLLNISNGELTAIMDDLELKALLFDGNYLWTANEIPASPVIVKKTRRPAMVAKQVLSNPCKPNDFVKLAEQAGAFVPPGHGSRIVIRYQGKTLGFSRHGNEEYSHQYRLLLKRAFVAAGLLILIGILFIPRLLQ